MVRGLPDARREPGSLLRVPGLMSEVRGRLVVVTNSIGNGVIDDKALCPFMQSHIRHYLNEEPILPNVTTY